MPPRRDTCPGGKKEGGSRARKKDIIRFELLCAEGSHGRKSVQEAEGRSKIAGGGFVRRRRQKAKKDVGGERRAEKSKRTKEEKKTARQRLSKEKRITEAIRNKKWDVFPGVKKKKKTQQAGSVLGAPMQSRSW